MALELDCQIIQYPMSSAFGKFWISMASDRE